MTAGQFDMFGAPPPAPPPCALHREHFDDSLLAVLQDRIPWEHRRFNGQAMPRLEWLASTVPGASYGYSGLTYEAGPMGPQSRELMAVASEVAGVEFNAVFANLYRDGSDSIGWHRDDEPILGPPERTVIASASFGSRRLFKMRRLDRTAEDSWMLGRGDLLIMGPGSQSEWSHCAPKTAKPVGPRVVLTFRRLFL